MKTNIINIGENPKVLKYKFIKNARVKSKMIISGFTQVTAYDKDYMSEIPPMTLFFNTLVTEVNNDTAVKIINIYDVKDSIKTPDVSKNINDILKLNFTLKMNSEGECLDVDISGINNDNSIIVSIAQSLKNQYQQMKKFPTDPIGIGGSWSYSYINDISNYTCLFTVRQHTNSIIKYDSVFHYFSDKNMLSTKDTNITSYKDFYGSSITNVSADIATGDAEIKSKNFTTSISEMKDQNNEIMQTEQTLLTSVDFVYDLPQNQANINDILNNIKNDKLPKLYS